MSTTATNTPATTTPENQVLTTPESLKAAAKLFKPGQEVVVTFKPIDDKVWQTATDGEPIIADGDLNTLGRRSLRAIVTNTPMELIINRSISDRSVRPGGVETDTALFGLMTVTQSESLWVNPKHIAEMVVLPAPEMHSIAGLDYKIMVRKSGLEVNGCTITRVNALKALRTFADKLGCSLTQSTKTIALDTVSTDGTVTATTADTIAALCEKIKAARNCDTTGKILVKFKPASDPIWRQDGSFMPAGGDFGRHVLAKIIDNETIEFRHVRPASGFIRFTHATSEQLHVQAEYIEEITMPSPARGTYCEIGGVTGNYDVNWLSNGGLKVGCQNLAPQGVMQVFAILAKFNGYTIDDIAAVATANKITYNPAASTLSA